VDPFVAVLFGGLFVFVGAIWLLGRYYPGSGLEQLGLKDARQIIETREALEAEDLDQMVAARNARRRARGQTEVSADDVELTVARELGEQARRRERYAAERRSPVAPRSDEDQDLDALLAATNARRRARGLPDRTAGQAREELGSDAPAPSAPGREPDSGASEPDGASSDTPEPDAR
jgi:hypothetical protein